ncbi:hypothetical protein ACFLZ9_02150 [Patescibacteria group bacterium]
MDKQKLIEKFGKEIENVQGLVDFLTSQVENIEDVSVSAKDNLAAYILDKHWWSGSSGIGMASIVGIYRDGQVVTKSYTYRDQYDARKDNWSLEFTKISIIEVSQNSVIVKVFPRREKHYARELTFHIAKSKKATNQLPKVSKAGKQAFEKKVIKAMDETVASNQHSHPLYLFSTSICEYKIDHERKLAAWIMFEQIDTDRTTMHGSGWLGDQFRYSLWRLAGNKKPERLVEDHAYTKERGCDLRGLRLFNGKIYVKNYQGKELEF